MQWQKENFTVTDNMKFLNKQFFGDSFITLGTKDVHDFYSKFVFIQPEDIMKRFMIKRKDCGSLDTCLGSTTNIE